MARPDRRLETRPDADLLRETNRNSAAFRVLYDRHAERIHGFLLKRTRDADAAIDLTAETFARAWISRDRYVDHDEGTVAPWLFGIARHVLASSVRRRTIERAARERLQLELATRAVTVDPIWLDGLDADLSSALGDLPDGQRRAIELRVLSDRAYEDVARELDISPQAARVRVHRGLRSIRQRFAQETRP